MQFLNKHRIVFDEVWYQNPLWQFIVLRMLNQKDLKLREEMRYRLGIFPYDCPVEEKIIKILPNNYTIRELDNKFITDFRVNNKFANRLFFEYKVIWDLLHKWDMNFANKFCPALNFGFDTITAYPDPDAEVTTVDGYLYNNNANYTTCRNASSCNSVYDNAAYMRIENDTGYTIMRAITLFKTTLNSVAITNTTLSFFIYYSFKTETDSGQSTTHAVSSNPASNTSLSTDDFDQLGSTSFGSIAYASLSTSAYNVITFNSTGLATITQGTNVIQKFGLRLAGDLNGSTPTGQNYIYICSAEDPTANNAHDPKLVVTYTTGWSKKINGVSLGKCMGVAKSSISKINGI